MQRRWRTSLTSTSEQDVLEQIIESLRSRLERLLQIISHDYELRLDFGAEDRIGEGQIVVGMKPDAILQADYPYLLGQSLHLLGHYLEKSMLWVDAVRLEEASDKPFLTSLWHALEDARLENALILRWPGAQRALDSRLPPNLGGSFVKLMNTTRQVELGLFLYGRGLTTAQFGDSVRAALDSAAPDIQAGVTGESPRASFEAATKVHSVVAHLIRAEHVGQQKPARGADQERNLEPDGPTDRLPEWEETGEVGEVTVLGRQRPLPEWYKPGSAPWFERGLGGKDIHASAIRSDRETILIPPTGDIERYRALWSEIQREAGFLTRRLTYLLEEEAYLRFGGHHRTGKLNVGKLWRQRLGVYRLFQRPISGNERWVAFSILVDESASMSAGDKVETATKGAVLLGETLDHLGIPFEIIGYTTEEYEARAAMKLGLTPAHAYRTTRCSALEHRIYKHFEEPYRLARARVTQIQARHNNWDEEHLLFALRRLQARNEDRKVMLILSDGQPNGDADHLIQEVRRITQLGVYIVGIGIGTDYVHQIYPEALVVSDFLSMAEELFGILAHQIRRREHGVRPASEVIRVA